MWSQVLVAPRRLERREHPKPRHEDLLPGEVIVELGAGAICGSDLPAFHGSFSPGPARFGMPGLPLHEIVGIVVDGGDSDLPLGGRVVGWAKRLAGFSEFLVADAHQLLPIDDQLNDVHATMIQPLACVLYARERLAGIEGSHVGVLGLGPLGLLLAHVVADAGAHEVTGVDAIDRSDVAKTFGLTTTVADTTYNWSRELRPDDRPEIVIEAIGHQTDTLVDAIEALAIEGQLLAFGVPITEFYAVPFHKFFRKNGILVSGTARDYRRLLGDAREYLCRYPELPGAYFTNIYPTTDATLAFEVASDPAPGRLKVGFRVER